MRVPHKNSDRILLTRLTGKPLDLKINDISHWEEHCFPSSLRAFVVVYTEMSSVTVQETFDDVDLEVNGKVVPHVE